MRKLDIFKNCNRNKIKTKIWMTTSLALFILLTCCVISIFNSFKNTEKESLKTVNNNLSNVKTSNIEKVNAENIENNISIQKVPVIISQDQSVGEFDFSSWNQSCDPLLVVINKNSPIFSDYKLNIIDYKNIKINSAVKDDLDSMINAAKKEGLNIYPSSGYRDVKRQTMLFNNKVLSLKKQGYKSNEAEIKAATVVARPKTSEHHTGLAIDFNGVKDDFYKTREFAWMIKNSANYGFILRYPKDKINFTNVIFEPWHFRYVGKTIAKKIAESGLCMEEYIKNTYL